MFKCCPLSRQVFDQIVEKYRNSFKLHPILFVPISKKVKRVVQTRILALSQVYFKMKIIDVNRGMVG